MAQAALITKAEAAELLGRSTRWVELNAAQLGARPVGTARNGKAVMAFDLANLPADAQLAWAERNKRKVVELVPQQATPGQMALALSVPEGPNLSAVDREEAERRYRVIEPLMRPDKYHGLHLQYPRKGDLIAFLAKQHKAAPRTIYHWLNAWKENGLPGLVTKDRADKGIPRAMTPAAIDFVVAMRLPRQGSYGELSMREMHRGYGEERVWREAHIGKVLGEFERRKYARYLDADGRLAESARLPEISYSCLKQWVGRVPEVMQVMARGGVEAFSNTQEIISFRAIADVQPLDYVVMDHRTLDFFCMVWERGEWKLVRPWITAAIDMRTRKWLGWVVVETPSSDSIACVLKRVFLDWGLPVSVYWDNGKDFRCEWLEGRRAQNRQAAAVGELGTAWRGVLDSLSVRVHHAIVKRARAKLIEPNFHRTSQFDKSTPWWCGNKPTARPERFDALLEQHERFLRGEAEPAFPTIQEVAAIYDDTMDMLNEREMPQAEGMRKPTPTGMGWMSPNEAWEKLIRSVQRRQVPAEVLQFAFAKRRTVTVQHGEVRASFGGRTFHYRLTGNPVGLMAYNGREVEFAYDPHDLETVALYVDSRLIGLADNVELRHMGEADFVQDERDRRASRREVRKAIELVQATTYVPGVVERAVRRQAVQPARLEPPRVEVRAALPEGIEQAARAVEEGKAFRFADAGTGGDLVREADDAAYRDDDPDDEFQFFSTR